MMMTDDSNGKAATRNVVKFVSLRQCIHMNGSNFSLVSTVRDTNNIIIMLIFQGYLLLLLVSTNISELF